MAWPELQQAVAACQACKLCEGRKNTVFGAGHPPLDDGSAPQVDWLIVGDAPDEDEDRTGRGGWKHVGEHQGSGQEDDGEHR